MKHEAIFKKMQKKIEALEKDNERLKDENKKLKVELEYFKKRKASGRQKHNAKWTENYNDFVNFYEQGMALVEIAERKGISERSVYRYKAYYEELKKNQKNK